MLPVFGDVERGVDDRPRADRFVGRKEYVHRRLVVLLERVRNPRAVKRQAHGHAQTFVFAFALPMAGPFGSSGDVRSPASLSRRKSDLLLLGGCGRTADIDLAGPSSRNVDLQARDTLQ